MRCGLLVCRESVERGIVVLLQWLWGMAVLGATGGASSSPTKSEGDSADAKQTVLWKEVSEVVIFEG